MNHTRSFFVPAGESQPSSPAVTCAIGTALLLVCLLTAGAGITHAQPARKFVEPFLHAVTDPGRLPYSVLSPLKGGPLNVLFIGSGQFTGESLMELSRRTDILAGSVLTVSRTELGTAGEGYPQRDAVLSEMIRLLSEQWDVVVLDFEIARLGDDILNRLLAAVDGGMGLLYVGRSDDIAPFANGKGPDGRTFEALRYSAPRPEIVGTRKKGVVAAVERLAADALPAQAGDYYTGLAQALVLCAVRDTGVTVFKYDLPAKIEQEGMNVMNFLVHLRNTGEQKVLTPVCRFRNRKNEVVAEISYNYKVVDGESYVRIPYPLIPIGDYSMDVTVLDGDKAVACSSASFTVTSGFKILSVEPWEYSIDDDDVIVGRIRLNKEFEEGMHISAEVRDRWNRLLDSQNLELYPSYTTATFNFLIKESPGGVLFLRVLFYHGPTLIHAHETPISVRKRLGPDEFITVVQEKSPSDTARPGAYGVLADAGVDAFAFDSTRLPAPDLVYRWGLDTAGSGGMIVPVLPSALLAPPVAQDRNARDREKYVTALFDTLAHFAPPMYVFQEPGARDILTPEEAAKITRKDTPSVLTGTVGAAGDIIGYTPVSFAAAGSEPSGDTGVYPVKGFMYTPANIYNDTDDYAGALPWMTVISGGRCVWWQPLWSGYTAAIAPADRISPVFGRMLDESGFFRDGGDMLLLGAQRNSGGDFLRTSVSGGPETAIAHATFTRGGAHFVVACMTPGAGPAEMRLTIASDTPYNIYNCRTGEFLGNIRDVNRTLHPGTGDVLALLTYRVRSLDVMCMGNVVKQGGEVPFTVSVVTESGSPGDHFIRVRVFGPDGVERPWFTRTLSAPGGHCESVLRIADNEEPGQWRIEARDVATGRTSDKKIMIIGIPRL